jgi:hypothetical protein
MNVIEHTALADCPVELIDFVIRHYMEHKI